jgi:glycosyltransferase involved in cell wall biosynthesis
VPGPQLVSCIMPTADRRGFVPRAIELFLAQDHEPRELIVLDDGTDPVGDLVDEVAGDDPRIRYERLPVRMVLGAKRNLGCELARGDLIAHWDDDDWYAPDRLSVQLAELIRNGALLCGLSSVLFHDPASGDTWRYRYPASDRRPWVAGASMLYRRSLWQRTPFEDVPRGEDTRFAWAAHREEVAMLRRDGLMVAMLHPHNSTSKSFRGARWQQVDPAVVARITAAGRADVAQVEPARPRARDGAARDRAPTVGQVADRPAVSACLVSWKRPQHLPRIVASIAAHPFITEVLVWNNNPAVDLDVHGDSVRVIDAPRNFGCYGRYLCAQQARNDLIYTQDDDVLVHNVPEIVDAFTADPSRMAHALAPRHFEARHDLVFGDAQLGWLGWGAIFDRSWLDQFRQLPPEVLGSRLFEREADVYFSIMFRHGHQTLRARIDHLPGHSRRGEALYRDPDAGTLRTAAIRHALALAREVRRPFLPPLWNVVITSHDYGHFLRASAESVLANRADAVVTIVDDASTDDSLAVAEKLAGEHPGVEVLAMPGRVGPAAAANRGIAHRDSAFVVRLDADDRIGPDYLRAAEQVLVAGADVANPDAILFGREHGRWSTPTRTSLDDLLAHNRVHCASAFRRGLWVEVGGFDEDLPKWIDYDFWIRVAARGARIVRCPGDHFHYRRHEGSLSERPPDAAEMNRRIRHRHAALYDAPTRGRAPVQR